MGDISKGVANTLKPAEKIYKKKFKGSKYFYVYRPVPYPDQVLRHLFFVERRESFMYSNLEFKRRRNHGSNGTVTLLINSWRT